MDTDFNRTERQRKVMGLAMEKAKQADFNTLRILVGTVFPQISTSIGVDDLMTIAKDVKKYYIGQTSGFPFSHSEMKIGKKDCVIPTTLESNVVQLHSFLYDDTQFVPSGVVKNISAKIAEVSGLGSPGKDTESGKNVGAEGSTSNQQQSPEPSESVDSALEEPEASPEANESESEQETEPEMSESPSFEETSELAAESLDNENQDTEITAPSELQPTTKVPETVIPDNESLSGPGGTQTAPGGNNGPGGNHSSGNESSQPNAFLEAPGQSHSSDTGVVTGPGH